MIEKIEIVGETDDVIWNIASHPKHRIIASCSSNIIVWMDSSLKDHEWFNGTGLMPEYSINNTSWIKAYEFGSFEHTRLIRKVTWSACGNMLISASFDHSVSIWEFLSKEIGWVSICKILGPESEVKSVDWSPHDEVLAACCRDRAIWIFSLCISKNRKRGTPIEYDCIGVITGHTNDIKKVKWHPVIPMILFSSSYDNTIIAWAPSSHLITDETRNLDWIRLFTLSGHSSTVWDFAFCSSGEYLLSCSDDSSIVLWHSDFRNRHNKFNTFNEVNSALMTTFKLILQNQSSADNLSKYHQIDQANNFTNSIHLYNYPLYSVDWCKYMNCIVVSSADGSLNFFMFTDSKLKHIYNLMNAHEGEINSVSWLNDNKIGEFVSGGDDGRIILWKINVNEF
ncbi:putative cytosolic iron-sulfur protein assembly protein Ciao1 [Cryptosporidium felis]|nr:putative cytosolic iron-sulfur protein assembly protein Ciao1 [Cryptosporidium felis]